MAIRWGDLSDSARARIETDHGVKAGQRTRKPVDRSLEEGLLSQLRMLKIPKPEREHRFHPTRKWRFDLAWPEAKFAVEVDGGTWVGGGHVRGQQNESDCEKGAEAALLGWRVIHVNNHMVEDGRAASYVERYLLGGRDA